MNARRSTVHFHSLFGRVYWSVKVSRRTYSVASLSHSLSWATCTTSTLIWTFTMPLVIHFPKRTFRRPFLAIFGGGLDATVNLEGLRPAIGFWIRFQQCYDLKNGVLAQALSISVLGLTMTQKRSIPMTVVMILMIAMMPVTMTTGTLWRVGILVSRSLLNLEDFCHIPGCSGRCYLCSPWGSLCWGDLERRRWWWIEIRLDFDLKQWTPFPWDSMLGLRMNGNG